MKELVKSYYKENDLVSHQIESFNDFIENRLQRIVNQVAIASDGGEKGVVETDIEGLSIWIKPWNEIRSIHIGRPQMKEADGSVRRLTPMEARLRNITYAAPIYQTATVIREGVPIYQEEVEIGMMPIMVLSKGCNVEKGNLEKNLESPLSDEEYREKLVELGEDPTDPGGYFIINGSERSLVALEDLAPNEIMVEYSSRYGSKVETGKVFSQKAGHRALVVVEKKRDGSLETSVPVISGRISLIVLLKALGAVTQDEILSITGREVDIARYILANIETCEDDLEVKTHEEALDYLGRKLAPGQAKDYQLKRVDNLLDRALFPHLGDKSSSRMKKAVFLGRMARFVIQLANGSRVENDKDHYANKRLNLAGDLMVDLFRTSLIALLRDFRYQIERAFSRNRDLRPKTAIRSDVLSDKMLQALATGNWVGGRSGVSQLLDRTSRMSTLSHLRRVSSPLSRSQAHFEARDLHPTQFGRLCPNETPEGPNCGLVKNLSIMAQVTKGVDEDEVKKSIEGLGYRPLKEISMEGSGIYVNGDLIGVTTDPLTFVGRVRGRRREGLISNEVNVSYDEDNDSVIVNCDSGRIRRPLIVVNDGGSLLKRSHLEQLKRGKIGWRDLIVDGIIEYVDAGEEEDLLVAPYPEDVMEEHTHLEVDPAAILGIASIHIPFPEYNSSPRITMGSTMIKQSLGIGDANYKIRPDTRGHMLHYPQTPIVKTLGLELGGLENRISGQNFVVAMLPFWGYNMEDAVVFNKSSIERGLSRSTFFRTYEAEEQRYPGGQEDRFEIPPPEVTGVLDRSEYKDLDEDGLIFPETFVKGGGAIIGKSSPPRFLEEPTEFLGTQKRREASITSRHEEDGIVDSVMISESENGSLITKVKIRSERIPELGDKFASRHGQKGVIGIIAPQEDMPFTEDGIVPDMILNPHAIPSRMTFGHMLEMIGGKVGAIEGRAVEGTPFSGEDEESLRRALVENGFKYTGREIIYDGKTGRPVPVGIFIGVIYTLKLHHMVAGKFHARSRGPVQVLTRQPTKGRAREGGLRFGEMERDCLIAHGASMVAKDRLLDQSDKWTLMVCDRCGHVAMEDRRGVTRCPLCGEDAKVYPVEISYAFKLLIDELKSMVIAPRLRLGDIK